MNLSEKILLRLSKNPSDQRAHAAPQEWDLTTALTTIERTIPEFMKSIHGKKIVDFGCGLGYQSVALAQKGAGWVLGVDINPKSLEKAKALAKVSAAGNRCEFKNQISPSDYGQYDIVISQNSMEHFPDPIGILGIMKKAIKKDGKIYITFGPPWFAPYGSHMQFFTRIPWVNLFFDENTVMKVRSRFRDDGATRYEDVESGLNKMTIGKFERIIRECGMRLEYKKYECVKKINFLAGLPVARELFINHVSCILTRDENHV